MTRSFSNTLLFESTLDSITSHNPILYNVSKTLFTPTVRIVEEDCGTLLGKSFPLSYRCEGFIEVETGLPISSTRRLALIAGGATNVDVRSLSTCVSSGGICRTCLGSSRPLLTVPATGQLYRVEPELILDIQQSFVQIETGQHILNLQYDESLFDYVYLFQDGVIIDSSEYSVAGSKVTFVGTPTSGTEIIVRFLVKSHIEYYNWLCSTFAGSLLGVRQIYNDVLPVRKKLLLDSIPRIDLDVLQTQLEQTDIGEDDIISYLNNVKDPLEKAVFICVLGAIFLNQ